MLTKADLPTLETRRIKTMAIETFKILNGLAPPVLSALLIKRENKYNFRYSNIFFQSWFAVEYSSCFISVMNLNLYVRCFDSLMSRGPSRGPNNFYVCNPGRSCCSVKPG